MYHPNKNCIIAPSVSIKLEVKRSDIPIAGNAIASGDDAYDAIGYPVAGPGSDLQTT